MAQIARGTLQRLSKVGRTEPDRTADSPTRGALFSPGFAALAEGDDFRRVDGFAVDLHFDNFSFFVDQIVDAPRRFVFWIEQAVLFRDVAAPVAQEREGDADFFSPGVIAEWAVHAYTQDRKSV